MLRCMAGRVSRGDEDFTKLEAIAVFYLLALESVLGTAFLACVDFGGFHPRTQLPRTAYQIGMNVGLENVRDRDACFARHLDVDVAIRARIENARDAFIVIADDVGKLRYAFGLDYLENERHAKT